MARLSDEQLNSLDKNALIIIVGSLQDQLESIQSRLDSANTMISDNNRQIEMLTEQIRIMNQHRFGRKSESDLNEMDGQLTLFDIRKPIIQIVPCKGRKEITPKITGFERAFENSEYVTVSELATDTDTFLRRYSGKVVDKSLP